MELVLLACLLLCQDVEVSKSELLGRFDPSTNPAFEKVEPSHSTKSETYLRREAYAAFIRMHEAARVDGIQLTIVSGTRSFDQQRRIWERKWSSPAYARWEPQSKARHILQFSAMPGTSRHHWGTDVDLNSVESSYFESSQEGRAVYQWLRDNAARFGFHQVYGSRDRRPDGYKEEKWHWSYMPLATGFLDKYLDGVNYSDITGFNGAEVAGEIAVIRDYVAGIDELVPAADDQIAVSDVQSVPGAPAPLMVRPTPDDVHGGSDTAHGARQRPATR